MINVKDFNKSEVLKDGTHIEIRAIRPEDKQMLADAFYALERESRYTRFFGFKDHITDQEIKGATEVDFEQEVALVVTTVDAGNEIIIAGGRYILLRHSPGTPLQAEVAFTVEEDYQGHGLAGRLFNCLADIARTKGVATFEAEVLPGNKAMIAVFKRRGLPMNQKNIDGLIHVTLSLAGDIA